MTALVEPETRAPISKPNAKAAALISLDKSGCLTGKIFAVSSCVEFGSYYVVGSDLLGMVPASLVRFADAELIEEGPEHVVLRSRGDLHADAASGALVYGVHYFRKDQLHDFKKAPARIH